MKDAEWIRAERESEVDGKLRSRVTVYRMTPTGISELR